MSDLGNIKYIKGSLRFKGATDENIGLPISLERTDKELEEYSRNTNLNLALLFDNERQKSTLFIPTCKFNLIFKNSYFGTAGLLNSNETYPYPPFNNNLYYSNVLADKQSQINYNCTEPIAWQGYPQYDEFKFIRTDYNISGWTTGENKHLSFQPDQSTFYNWYFHLTYAFSSTTASTMQYQINQDHSFTWVAGDGIPFMISKLIDGDGKPIIRFTCPMSHGLNVGESVVINIQNGTSCDGITTFEVYSLGNGYLDSELKIFNVYDVGYSCGVLFDGNEGTFKRITNILNTGETTSKYYVRIHKILTPYNQAVVTNSGFEFNALRTTRKFESKSLQPPYFGNKGRVSIKEDSQSYNVSFQEYLDIQGMVDNQRRPLTEVFVTVVNRGYFGWFNKPIKPNQPALKQGWEFNLGPELNNWWLSQTSLTQIPTNFWTNTTPFTNYIGEGSDPVISNLKFYYNRDLQVGDTILGDFCEWNDFEQTERVISDYYHKLQFNSSNFSIGPRTYQLGYYYKPHNKLTMKVYSPYVEVSNEGNPQNYRIENFPNYAYFSTSDQNFRWRDIYPYGFIDESNIGVDYTFMNGRHYLYENFFFKIIPEGTNSLSISTSVNDPIIDGCE